MAYVVSTTTTTLGSGTAFSADIGVNLANDLILVLVGWRSSGTISISGYTGINSQQNTDAYSSRFFVKIGGGSEVAPPCAITGGAASAIAVVYVIRDADVSGTAANAIDSSGFRAGSLGATLTSSALTPTAANCLIVHGAIWDQTAILAPFADLNTLASKYAPDGLSSAISGIIYHAPATTAIPTFTFTGNNASNTGESWAIAVKNGSGGDLPLRLADGRNYIHTLGGFSSPTESAPNAFSISAIASINTHTVKSTLAFGRPIGDPWAVLGHKFTIATNLGADAWVGAYMSCTSINVSGKLIAFQYGFGSTVDSTRIGAQGNIVVLVDNVNNWTAYQCLPQAKWASNGYGTLIIKPGTTTAYANSASAVDLTQIVAIGYLHHRVAGATASIDVYFNSPIIESSTGAFIGGGSDGNGAVITEYLYLSGGGTYNGLASLQGIGQFLNRFGVQYGNGSAATYIKHQIQSYELPSTAEVQWRSGASSAGVTIYAASGDTMDFSSSIFSTESAQTFTIHASSSLSATYSFTNTTFQGWTVTDNAGIPSNGTTTGWAGVAFKSGGTVTIAGGGDLTNCTISKTTSSTAALAITANGTTINTSTISRLMNTGASATYHISLGASVTATTWNGTTLSDGTPEIYSALASGTLTITLDGTGTALVAADVTFVGGSTATAVIASPQVYQTVTVSGITTGSRVQIYDTTSSTELFNGTASAGDTVVSGSTATWTDPLAASANRAIRVRVAYVNGATAKLWQENTGLTCGQTSGTESVTYPITQVADTTYNANAIDGPAIYATSGITFTDAATDLVNINIAADTVALKTIYACFVYWLFTAAGIDDDVAYIDGVDPANYILTSMKIRNTSTDPLKITDGYFYDSTGSVENCVDVAGSSGNIYPMPAHVVPYQTTGTYAITGDISTVLAAIPSDTDNATAVLAAAAATPIASNIKKVNDITVDGNGQDATPWGPA